jgi:predicted RNA-binding Zn ribbon-like protein
MTFSWTQHRFSGGALALDVANSVILRADPARRLDRLAEPAQLRALPQAVVIYCAEKQDLGAVSGVAPENESHFLHLRESIDAFYRRRVETGEDDPAQLADMLEAIACVLRRPALPDAVSLDLATAQSALRLITMPDPQRLKICPNCGWLFLDRSKNKSRAWCDMTVCGNRAKARLHYRKKKEIAP